jgi:iron complex outermembrane recepter protein
MGKRTYILFFLLLSSSASVATSQKTVLPPVVVKAFKQSKPSITNGPKTVISREQLAMSGATTLAQALQHLGGVQQQDTTGNGSQVLLSMRGFGSNANSNTLLLVNGIPLTNPDLAPPNLNTIPLHEIEYIEIISGSESVQYGDQAVGGVINLITREQAKEKAEVACGLGSYNQRHCYAAFYHNKSRLKSAISLSSSHTDNYRDHNDYDQHLLMGKLSHPYASGRLSFDYTFGKEDMQYPGALTAAEVRQNRRQANNDINYFKDWNGSFRLRHQQTLTENWRLDSHLVHRLMRGNGVLFSRFTQSRTTDLFNPQIKGSIGIATIKSGLDFQQDNYRLDSLFGTTEDRQKKYGVMALANLALYPRTTLAIGARAAEQQSHLQTLTSTHHLNRALATTLGLSYQILPTMHVYLRRAGSFRFPKADENASTPPGSTGLRTQRGIAYETGMEWSGDSASFKAGLYQLALRDEIMFDPTQTPQDPFGTNRNLAPTIRRGFTVSGKHQLTSRLALDGQYNFVNARFQHGINTGNRIPLVSENIVRAGLNLSLADHWFAYTEAIYTGNQYAANDDANVAGIIGGYTSYNFHLRYLYKQLTASLRVNNVFNKYYYFYTVFQPSMNTEFFYPAPGRNFTLNISYVFN